ncbi:twin-arginine translocase TatA/TatE family subunit [Arthrobacter sp. USHLN218]|uniref:twin-arginine translocase TatA/TatE family subunit n=2 Tax=Arthrobacter sp. USHLN218 TaxID=3081232 RepID=UPI003016BB3C
MARLFDNPMVLVILLVVLLLLFGAPKLPGIARSLGQSMRIFKSEVTELKGVDPEAADPNRQDSATKSEDERMRKGRALNSDGA